MGSEQCPGPMSPTQTLFPIFCLQARSKAFGGPLAHVMAQSSLSRPVSRLSPLSDVTNVQRPRLGFDKVQGGRAAGGGGGGLPGTGGGAQEGAPKGVEFVQEYAMGMDEGGGGSPASVAGSTVGFVGA
jgi:hypothetical protein